MLHVTLICCSVWIYELQRKSHWRLGLCLKVESWCSVGSFMMYRTRSCSSLIQYLAFPVYWSWTGRCLKANSQTLQHLNTQNTKHSENNPTLLNVKVLNVLHNYTHLDMLELLMEQIWVKYKGSHFQLSEISRKFSSVMWCVRRRWVWWWCSEISWLVIFSTEAEHFRSYSSSNPEL